MSSTQNLGDLVPRGVAPDRIALIALDESLRETRYTYAELDARANALARGLLRRGIASGQRVAVLAANCADYLVVLLGALRAGIVVVPVNYKFPKRLSDFVLSDSGAVLAFADARHRSALPANLPAVEFGKEGADGFDALLDEGPFDAKVPDAHELAIILYTSGSTGVPKGVRLSHESHLWILRTRLAGQDLSGERYLVAAPLYHMNALALCQLAVAGGSTIILLRQFKAADYIGAASRYRATWLTSVPPMMAMVLREKEELARADLSSVRVVRMGSAPVSESLFEGIAGIMPQARIINSYGTTEGGPVTFGPHPHGKPQPRMSVGYAHPQVQLRLTDAQGKIAAHGVLQIRSPGLMLGYHNRPDLAAAVTADGYYITGDIFRQDEDGFYYFVGRNDDMFVCGGENIFPGEVEAVLEAHPAVQQACVVPLEDDIKGHKPVAFIVPTPGHLIDEDAIRRYALEHAPAYQHPRRVWFLDSLPLASTGKVDRSLLKRSAQRQSISQTSPGAS